MTDIQFFYRRDTLQVDAVFVDCETMSTVFKDPMVYGEVNVVDPSYAVTRNHRVVLDEAGLVVDTVASPNPVQPIPTETPLDTLLASLTEYGVHSFTPAQVDAFIDSVSSVAELKALLKTVSKCVVALAEYFQTSA